MSFTDSSNVSLQLLFRHHGWSMRAAWAECLSCCDEYAHESLQSFVCSSNERTKRKSASSAFNTQQEDDNRMIVQYGLLVCTYYCKFIFPSTLVLRAVRYTSVNSSNLNPSVDQCINKTIPQQLMSAILGRNA